MKMKCPFCSQEMTRGYVEAGRFFMWKEKDENGRKHEYLLAKSYMGGAKLDGEMCLVCRKLVLDIPEGNF